MPASKTQRPVTRLDPRSPLLAALAGAEVILVSSDLGSGLRHGLGSAIAVALVALVYRMRRRA